MRRKIILFSTLGAFLALGFAIIPLSDYKYKEHALPATFEEFLEQKQKIDKELGARPGNEEKLLRFGPGKTEYALLYIHGFGASRGEGEEVIDRVAAKLQANTYYIRLPGHGTNMEDHARVQYTDYLDAGEEAVRMMPMIGKKVIVIGTSMGALIATHVTANHPELVHAVVLASPFYEFSRKEANLSGYPGMMPIVEMIGGGKVRDAGRNRNDPNDTSLDGYENYWYSKQYFVALRGLARLKRAVARPEIFGRITQPVLMLYYYKDEEHQDKAASVSAMLDAFHQFGKFSKPNPLNRATAIPGGDHILLSHWVKSDHETAEKEILRFVEDVKKADESK